MFDSDGNFISQFRAESDAVVKLEAYQFELILTDSESESQSETETDAEKNRQNVDHSHSHREAVLPKLLGNTDWYCII